MLVGFFKNLLFALLIFYSLQLFAKDFDIEISGNV